MSEAITTEDQITPNWLTTRLRENGHLQRGHVSRVSKECFTSHFSQICRLDLTYSSDAAPLLPLNMLLKAALPDIEGSLNMGMIEVSAYVTIAEAMADPPLVLCFDAVYSAESNRSHILIQDLSPTHFQPEIPIPPSRRHCELSVESLAQFHAFGWQNPGLGTTIGVLLDQPALNEIVAQAQTGLAGIADYLGDRLSPNRRSIYDRAIGVMVRILGASPHLHGA